MKIVTIVGARPQFIKAVAVSRAIERYNRENRAPRITEILVHTDQHYDHNMSQIFFEQMQLPNPKYNLGVGSGKHGEMTGAILWKTENALIKERPDWVLVYGDTNSTLAGALAAVKLHIPVAHVEAGLRSFNRYMPEEINRVVTDHISTILFCPTKTSVLNLEKEGITDGVLRVGDVMYDAFLANKELAQKTSSILTDLDLKPRNYCLATVHRQENTDDPRRLLNIFGALEALATAECPFILPIHPRTQKALQFCNSSDLPNKYVRVIPPVSYMDLIALEIHAKIILTDSGGVQKEALFSRVPCITLRDETEWVETLENGWNRLAGADSQKIVRAFYDAKKSSPNGEPDFYGKGNASQLILDRLTFNS